ncbi:MAG TPA: hypothetical protein VL550_09155 [Rhodocyclaceae bacterium]|nr:hypothetical protein [Rhodocyclaceae bacterium]
MKFETSLLRRGVAAAGLLAGLMLGTGAALAQVTPPVPTTQTPAAGAPNAGPGGFAERCKADPQKCAEFKQRMEERKAACAQGPDACKAWEKQEHAKMKAWCSASPENGQTCAEMKQKREEHRAACKADPNAPHCHHKMPPADGTPVPPPTAPNASVQ